MSHLASSHLNSSLGATDSPFTAYPTPLRMNFQLLKVPRRAPHNHDAAWPPHPGVQGTCDLLVQEVWDPGTQDLQDGHLPSRLVLQTDVGQWHRPPARCRLGLSKVFSAAWFPSAKYFVNFPGCIQMKNKAVPLIPRNHCHTLGVSSWLGQEVSPEATRKLRTWLTPY